MELSEEVVQALKNTTVLELAQLLEDGLIHSCNLHEETTALEFIQTVLPEYNCYKK